MIKKILIRLITKQSFANFWVFYLVLTGVEANKVLLALFLVLHEIKQNGKGIFLIIIRTIAVASRLSISLIYN